MDRQRKPFETRQIKIAPATAGARGNGVFALEPIAAGEVVDACPCIDLDVAACDQVRGTPIDDYYFFHPGDEERGLLALGLASLMNHSEAPNTGTRYHHDPALGWIVLVDATRDIAAGEEITRRYACPPWFEPR